MTAPRWFMKRLHAISPDLECEFLDREGCFAITQRLANTPSTETLTRRVADEALVQLAKDGRAVNRADVERAVYLQVQRNVIVFRVEDGAGTPLPLDDRALNRLERMAFYVRNRTAKDWIHAGDIEQYEAKRSRARAIEAIWDDVKKDDLFHQLVGDALAGLRLKYHVGGPLPEKSGGPLPPKSATEAA